MKLTDFHIIKKEKQLVGPKRKSSSLIAYDRIIDQTLNRFIVTDKGESVKVSSIDKKLLLNIVSKNPEKYLKN